MNGTYFFEVHYELLSLLRQLASAVRPVQEMGRDSYADVASKVWLQRFATEFVSEYPEEVLHSLRKLRDVRYRLDAAKYLPTPYKFVCKLSKLVKQIWPVQPAVLYAYES